MEGYKVHTHHTEPPVRSVRSVRGALLSVPALVPSVATLRPVRVDRVRSVATLPCRVGVTLRSGCDLDRAIIDGPSGLDRAKEGGPGCVCE